MAAIILEAIRQGIAAGLQQRADSVGSDWLRPHAHMELYEPEGFMPP